MKESKLLIGVLFIIDFIITGFLTMYAWNNVVSVVFNLMTLSFWQAWAVGSVISFFTYQGRRKIESCTEELIYDISYTLVTWLIMFIAVSIAF